MGVVWVRMRSRKDGAEPKPNCGLAAVFGLVGTLAALPEHEMGVEGDQ